MNTLLRSIFAASLGLVILSVAACAHDPNEDQDPIFGVVGGGQDQQQTQQGQQSGPQGRVIQDQQ